MSFKNWLYDRFNVEKWPILAQNFGNKTQFFAIITNSNQFSFVFIGFNVWFYIRKDKDWVYWSSQFQVRSVEMVKNCQKMKNQKVGWRQISLERVTEHLQSSSIAHSKERKNRIGAPAPLTDFSSAFKPLNNKENGQSLFWSITHFGLSHENGILTISTRNMPQMISKRS